MSNYLMKMIISQVAEKPVEPDVDVTSIPLTFTAEEPETSVSIWQDGEPNVDGLQYRLGTSGGWTKYEIETQITLENVGDTVQFQNTSDTLSRDWDYVYFYINGKAAASGNVMSLLNYATECYEACFRNLFQGCGGLTAAPELPATILAKECYSYMFSQCPNLTTAPELPATALATECYFSMFENSGITVPPKILPAMTLRPYCYKNMFKGCENLTTSPELPATVMAEGCYDQLLASTSITEAPALPATELADGCYQQMFNSCRELIKGPELPATDLKYECYQQMFAWCFELNEIKVHFTSWGEDIEHFTYNWMSGVGSTGTFYAPAELEDKRGNNHYIPNGWTKIDI
jgi:hypothetical protein